MAGPEPTAVGGRVEPMQLVEKAPIVAPLPGIAETCYVSPPPPPCFDTLGMRTMGRPHPEPAEGPVPSLPKTSS